MLFFVLLLAFAPARSLDSCLSSKEREIVLLNYGALHVEGGACAQCSDSIFEEAPGLCLDPETLASSSCVVSAPASQADQVVYVLRNTFAFDSVQFDAPGGYAYFVAAEGRVARTRPCPSGARVFVKRRASAQLATNETCAAVERGCTAVAHPRALYNHSENRCNFGASASNACAATDDGFECSCGDSYTGARCQFKKTDYCCAGECPFSEVSLRGQSAAFRAAWCGGLNVDCRSPDGEAPPVCDCLDAYLGDFCETSKCDRSCGERSTGAPPGRCVATEAGHRCECPNVWPAYYLPETGCAENAAHDAELLAACGVREVAGPVTSSWSKTCNGAGYCSREGCVCDSASLVPEANCVASRCERCNEAHSTCSEVSGVCECDELTSGDACETSRCTSTGGAYTDETERACDCGRLARWSPRTPTRNAGCVLKVPSVGGVRPGEAFVFFSANACARRWPVGSKAATPAARSRSSRRAPTPRTPPITCDSAAAGPFPRARAP